MTFIAVRCPHCQSDQIVKAQYAFRGVDKSPSRQELVWPRALVRPRSIGDTGVMIHIQSLIDAAKCVETVRALRWPNGVCGPRCESFEMTTQGRDDTHSERQRYVCPSCERRCDALTDTSFAGQHQPRRVWIRCLSCMGLHLSNYPMAQELDLKKEDVHQMTSQ